ncbi:Regulatory protein BlaR1 [Gimesia chilikensis]|uniref:Regulatory protein BlaR1 n=1 Tax=Gimesia chilikensis TaxID=2605989 RepID=A0A517WLG9_9PLAN|nr:M56 family metallopeptidase [Gimesia chilikensis]QDU06108.1 Regulatory protein BlaR1 [Gimesia chilikensis]
MAAISPEWINLVWQQVWQCTLLALIVWLICRVVRIRRAHLAYLLWLVVLLKFVTPPVWSSSSGLFCWLQNENAKDAQQSVATQPIEALTRTEWIRQLIGDDVEQLPEAEFGSLEVTVHDAEESSGETRSVPAMSNTIVKSVEPAAAVRQSARVSWLRVGLWCWAGVAAFIATVMLIRFLRCWRMIRNAGAVQCLELEAMLERLTQELGVKRRVRLMVTQSRIGPAVVGLWRPTILLPAAIAEARSPAELEPILAHELIHIRRGDLWIGLLQLLTAIVWWFHPLVWLTGRRLKFEMEQCCDEEVLAELNCDPRLYAAGLLEILELKQTLRTVPVVPGVRPLEITSKRMERIMRLGQGSQKRTPWWCWVVFVALAAVVLPGAAFVAGAAGENESDVTGTQSLFANELQESSQSSIKEIERDKFTEKWLRSMGARKQWYLTNENDVSDLITPDSVRHTYTLDHFLGVNLLEKARNVVGRSQAGEFLVDQIRARVKELISQMPEGSTSDHTEELPKAEILKQHSQKRKSLDGTCFLQRNELVVDSAAPEYHRLIKQVLTELAGNGADRIKVTATFICFTRSEFESWDLTTKQIKFYSSRQSLAEQVDHFLEVETFEPELVHRGTLYHDIYNLENRPFTRRDFKVAVREKKFGGSSSGSVLLANGQTIRMTRKLDLKHSSIDEHIAQERGLYDSGQVLELKVNDLPAEGMADQIRLEYKLSTSSIEGKQILTKFDIETREEKNIEVPLMRRNSFQNITLLRSGQSLLVGGLPVSTKREDPLLLALILKTERVQIPEQWLLMGQGVNSDAGITGHVQLDPFEFKDIPIIEFYPVADLVVPIRRRMILGAQQSPLFEQPRYEPLIELIKQNIEPEVWSDPQKTDSVIKPFEKDKNLYLMVRAKRATHDQIKDLLARIRAVQDRQVCLKLELITAEDLTAWREAWDESASPETRDLGMQLKSRKLDEGILLSPRQIRLLKQKAVKADRLQHQALMNVTLFNGQSTELNLSGSLVPDENSKSLIQLRPELINNRQLRLSYVINARNALDAISHVQNTTIPQGQSLIVDISDQLAGGDSSFLFDQFVRQAELSYQKQAKRSFLLVTPKILTATSPPPVYQDPANPEQKWDPAESKQDWKEFD